MAKAIKTTHNTTARGNRQRCYALHDVLHLEIVMQRVLAALPLVDLQTFLSACGGEQVLAWLLTDTALWEELLTQHFGGRRCIAPEAQADEEEPGDDGFDDDEDEENEEDGHSDEEDEDEGEGDEADPQETEEGQIGLAEQRNSMNTPSDGGAAIAPDTQDQNVRGTAAITTSTSVTTLPVEMPAWLNVENACAPMHEFIVSLTEWMQFQQRVVVLADDICTIEDLDGHAIDAIAFPGNAMMRNPYNGAASAVFRRAGEELDRHTSRLSMSLHVGQCRVTPGFDSGVRVLIHCLGPYNSHQRLYPTLAKTYRNVLRNAKRESVACLAMTSISTGNFGVPIPEAARTAMLAIQQFLRAHHDWQGRVGIVCYETDVFEAFRDERQRVLNGFNLSSG